MIQNKINIVSELKKTLNSQKIEIKQAAAWDDEGNQQGFMSPERKHTPLAEDEIKSKDTYASSGRRSKSQQNNFMTPRLRMRARNQQRIQDEIDAEAKRSSHKSR